MLKITETVNCPLTGEMPYDLTSITNNCNKCSLFQGKVERTNRKKAITEYFVICNFDKLDEKIKELLPRIDIVSRKERVSG